MIIGDFCNARSDTVWVVRGALVAGMQAPAIAIATVKVPQTLHPGVQYRVLMAASIVDASRAASITRLRSTSQ